MIFDKSKYYICRSIELELPLNIKTPVVHYLIFPLITVKYVHHFA